MASSCGGPLLVWEQSSVCDEMLRQDAQGRQSAVALRAACGQCLTLWGRLIAHGWQSFATPERHLDRRLCVEYGQLVQKTGGGKANPPANWRIRREGNLARALPPATSGCNLFDLFLCQHRATSF